MYEKPVVSFLNTIVYFQHNFSKNYIIENSKQNVKTKSIIYFNRFQIYK